MDGKRMTKKMTKKKLVRALMAVRTDNEVLSAKALELNDIISNFKMNQKHLELDVKAKTKELSTIAGYLAISICINFVAIGWVAWTKGWLS